VGLSVKGDTITALIITVPSIRVRIKQTILKWVPSITLKFDKPQKYALLAIILDIKTKLLI